MKPGEGTTRSRKMATNKEKSKYPSRNIRSSTARTIHNAEIEPGIIACATEECFYDISASKSIM